MYTLYAWLQQEPMSDNWLLAISGFAAAAVVAIAYFWGLPA